MAKTDFRLAVLALIEEVDPAFNPIKELVHLAKGGQDDGIRLSATKELASYLYPKQRPIDEMGKTGGDLIINVVRFGELEPMTVDTPRGAITIGTELPLVPLPEPVEEVIDADYDTD